VTLTATPQSGFRVRYWSGVNPGPAISSPTQTVTMTSARIVLVQFEIAPFRMFQLLGHVSSGEGWISPTRGAYREGEVVALTATPGAGSRVKRWSGTDNDASTATTNAVTMNDHKNVSVEFERSVDCNGNGAPDEADIAGGTSPDCDGNCVPDECQPDSDGNGVIDACDSANDPNLGGNDDTLVPGTGFALCGAGALPAFLLTIVGLAFLRGVRP
jgi:hypothetical protein